MYEISPLNDLPSNSPFPQGKTNQTKQTNKQTNNQT